MLITIQFEIGKKTCLRLIDLYFDNRQFVCNIDLKNDLCEMNGSSIVFKALIELLTNEFLIPRFFTKKRYD